LDRIDGAFVDKIYWKKYFHTRGFCGIEVQKGVIVMKNFKTLIIFCMLFVSRFSFAASTECQEKLLTAMDLTVGSYYTKNEMNYYDLVIVIANFKSTEDKNIYELKFDGQSGWIYFAKDCKSFSADFSFATFPVQEL
jgi:hypothetical protein